MSLVATLAQWSLLWAAIGAALAAVIRLFFGFGIIVLLEEIPKGPLAAAMLRPLLACAAMAAAVLGLRLLLGWEPSVLLLVLEVAIGALVYVVTAFLFAGSIARDFISLLRDSLNRRE